MVTRENGVFMENIILAIEAEIRTREAELVALRKSLDNLRTAGITITANAEEPRDGRYRGMKCGDAIRSFLVEKKKSTLDDIKDSLDRGGMEWGKYPKRQVALVISNNPLLYRLGSDGVVHFLPKQ
jgi:hypothetical protein